MAGDCFENRPGHANRNLAGGRTVEFPIDPFAKQCLIEGVDELGYMLNQQPAIAAYEAKRAGTVNTLA